MDLILPYKIGDLAESKSFLEGYRGAWFRCKINDMRVTETGHLECYLEYVDYPGENKEWIRLFQKNQACSKQQAGEQIMIRPSFPQWYWKDQVPQQSLDNDVIETVYETWKIGDLVDWLSEGCYWSGKITKLFSEDTVEVELLKPPIGEGQHYAANHNDLRPTLDWSLAGGWTVPLSQAKGKSWHVARVIHHKSAESETSESDEETSDVGDCGGGHDDGQGVQLLGASSKTFQEAPSSTIPKPSLAPNSMSSLNAQKDAILVSKAKLKPRSPSKSPAPSHGAEPGMGSSIKQEQGSSPIEHQAGDVRDQYLQKLDEVEGSLKKLIELTRSDEARRAAEVTISRAIGTHANG